MKAQQASERPRACDQVASVLLLLIHKQMYIGWPSGVLQQVLAANEGGCSFVDKCINTRKSTLSHSFVNM